jgi:hypothetical protein
MASGTTSKKEHRVMIETNPTSLWLTATSRHCVSKHQRMNSEISRSKDLNQTSGSISQSESGSLYSKMWKLKESLSTASTHLSADLIQEEEHVCHLEEILSVLKQTISKKQATMRMMEKRTLLARHSRSNNSMKHHSNPPGDDHNSSRHQFFSGSGIFVRQNSRESTPPIEFGHSLRLSYPGHSSSEAKNHHKASPRIYGPDQALLSGGERTIPKIKVSESDYMIAGMNEPYNSHSQESSLQRKIRRRIVSPNLVNSAINLKGDKSVKNWRRRPEYSEIMSESKSRIRKATEDNNLLRLKGSERKGTNYLHNLSHSMHSDLSSGGLKQNHTKQNNQNESMKFSQQSARESPMNQKKQKHSYPVKLDCEVESNYVLVKSEDRIPTVLEPQKTQSDRVFEKHLKSSKLSHTRHETLRSKLKSKALDNFSASESQIKKNNTASPLQNILKPSANSQLGIGNSSLQKSAEQLISEQLRDIPDGNLSSTKEHKRAISGAFNNMIQSSNKELLKSSKLDKIFSVGLLPGNQKASGPNPAAPMSSTDRKVASGRWLNLYQPLAGAATDNRNKQCLGSVRPISKGVVLSSALLSQTLQESSPIMNTSRQLSLETLEAIKLIQEEPENFRDEEDNAVDELRLADRMEGQHGHVLSEQVRMERRSMKPQHGANGLPAGWEDQRVVEEGDAGGVSQVYGANSGVSLVCRVTGSGRLEMIPEVSKDVSQPTNKLESGSNTQRWSGGNNKLASSSYKSVGKSGSTPTKALVLP